MFFLNVLLSIVIGLLPVVVVGFLLYAFFTQKNRAYEVEKQYIRKPLHVMVILGSLFVLFNIFAYDVAIGLGVGIFLATLVLCALLLIDKKKRTIVSYSISMVGLLSALSIGLRANGFVQIIDSITVGVCLALLFFIGSTKRISWDGMWLLRTKYDYVKRVFFNMPLLFSLKEGTGEKSRIVTVLKTTLIALLVFFVFVELLSAADPVFAEIVRELKEQAFGRIVLSLLVTIPFFVFASVWLPERESDNRDPLRFISISDLYVPMLIIVGLIGIFLFVQIKYLFGSHESLVDFGLTYSEYVRKGFVELIVASAIGGVISYVVFLKSRNLAVLRQKTGLIFVNIVMILELFMLLVSALKRDLLYVDAYGLTRTRVIGGAFLLWLAGLLIMLLLILWEKKVKERALFGVMGMLTVLFIAFINVVNIDQLIVSNYRPSDFHNESDYYYVNILSEDARVGWRDSITSVNTIWDSLSKNDTLSTDQLKEFTMSKLSMIALLEKREALDIKYGSKEDAKLILGYGFSDTLPDTIIARRRMQSFNYSEFMAYRMMQDEKDRFYKGLDCLLSDIFSYQMTHNIVNYTNEEQVLFGTERPFVINALDYYPTDFNLYPGEIGATDAKTNIQNYMKKHRIPLKCN